MSTICNVIPSEKLKAYADALGCSEAAAKVKVDLYMTANNSLKLPSEEDIVRFSLQEKIDEQLNNKSLRSSNDGKIILTKEQQNAVDTTADFIYNKLTGRDTNGKNYAVIQGKAGTGKTTIVKSIVDSIHSKHAYPTIAVAALSRKAVHVLGDKMLETIGGISTETLYTLSGADPAAGEDKFAINPKKEKFKKYDLIFIDEASMVAPNILKAIDEATQNKPELAIVFLGDYGQLRPIPKDKSKPAGKSEVFSRSDMLNSKLTQRIRQGEESPILPYADYYWNVSVGKSNEDILDFANKYGKSQITKEGALVFANKNFNTKNKIFEAYTRSIAQKNPSFVKIVAGKNTTVDSWNVEIHNRLFPDSPNKMCAGDSVMFYSPYKNESMGVSIDNAEEGIIDSISEEKDRDGIKYRTYYININDKLFPVNVLDSKKDKLLFRDVLNKLKKEAIAHNNAPNRTTYWKVYYEEAEKFIQASTEDDVITQEGLHMAYAITSHKAQGSTYDITVVDESDIQSVGSWDNQQRAESIYTAITRARNEVIMLSNRSADVEVNSFVEISDNVDNKKNTELKPIKNSKNVQNAGEIPSNIIFSKEWIDTGMFEGNKNQDSNSSINIYYGNNENADLSNFASRPFVHTWKDGKTTEFKSVEQAFQFSKARMANDREAARKILDSISPSEAKAIGKTVKNLDAKAWDANSYALMKTFIKESFEQNPDYRDKLISTGNAVLTHTQDNTRWKTDFPRALMEVRAELSGSTITSSEKISDEDFIVYSGDAKGSDSEWAFQTAAYGLDFIPYKTSDVNSENFEECESMVQQANRTLQRVFPIKPKSDSKEDIETANYKNNFIRRDWLQVKNSKQIVAIVEKFTTTQGFTDPYGNYYGGKEVVNGGTGWAVQMAIDNGIPVYVFNQSTGNWYNYKNGEWKTCDIPSLEKHFTGIGTRKMNDLGKAAIKEVLSKTFGKSVLDYDGYTPKHTIDRSLIDREDPMAKYANAFSPIMKKIMVSRVSRLFSEQLTKFVNYTIRQKKQNLKNFIEDHKGDTSEKTLLGIQKRQHLIDLFSDPSTGRAEVLSHIGLKNFLDSDFGLRKAMESYAEMSMEDVKDEWDLSDEAALEFINAYKTALDNLDMLFIDARTDIEKRERIAIDLVDAENDEVLRTEGEEEESEFGDNDDVSRINGNEGWNFKIRMTDPETLASAITKSILNNIVKVDSNGNEILDPFNSLQYYDGTQIHATLVGELSGMTSASDFYNKETGRFPVLEKLAYKMDKTDNIMTDDSGKKLPGKYPWVSQIIDIIKNDDSKISTFYTDFRNDFISYWMEKTDEESGTMKAFPMNSPNAMASSRNKAIQNFETNQRVNEDAIYNNGGLRKDKLELGRKLAEETLDMLNDAEMSGNDGYDIDPLIDNLYHMVGMIGFNTSKQAIEGMLFGEDGINKVFSLTGYLDDIFTRAEKSKGGHLVSDFEENYKNIASMIGIIEDAEAVSSTRQGDKTFYSYSAPNYFDSIIKNIKKEGEKRNAYINERFKKFKWYYRNNQWRSEWLRLFSEDEDVVKNFDTCQLTVIDNAYYRDWTENQITKAFVNMYFTADVKDDPVRYAWYSSPIFSDSPAAKFVKMVKYTGTPEEMKSQLTPLIRNVVKQELFRQKLVEERRKTKSKRIPNFDDNGHKFFFLNDLNTFVFNDEEYSGPFKEVLRTPMNNRNSAEVNRIIDKAVVQIMNNMFNSYMERFNNNSILKNSIMASVGQKVMSNDEEFRNAMEEYFWNQFYANTQIIQLTTTDLAFYKDLNLDGGVDFQKRFKETYASGKRLNVNSKNGRSVERTMYLKDIKYSSPSIKAIERILDSAIDKGFITKESKASIISKYKEIVVADGQAYRSMESFKSILDMMGIWNDSMQKTFNNMKNGTFDAQDFYTVWNTIKPFMFSNVETPTGVDSDVFGENMLVPHQNKNSEFILTAALGMLSYSLDESPAMRGIAQFFEAHPDIDVIQFESAVKVGNQGVVDLAFSNKTFEIFKEEYPNIAPVFDGVTDYESFKDRLDELLEKDVINQDSYNNMIYQMSLDEDETLKKLEEYATGKSENPNVKMSKNGYNPEIVHEISYEDYMIAQPTPPHLIDVKAVFGSQFRNLILSDLPENIVIDVNGKNYTKAEAQKLFKSLIVENLLDDFEDLKKRFDSIEEFQKALLNTIKGNPKYGRDIVEALRIVKTTDPNTGIVKKQFNVPTNNLSTTKKLQEIVNSMFKNAIQKQKINGGACILVSNFGYTEDLHMVYGDNGELIGAECYLPAWSKAFFNDFIDKNTGELLIDKIPDNLKRVIAYRIPTEHKYSMLPLYVKGFLPSQNGSVIMLPMETIVNSGEDFDVDKKFLMIPHFTTENLHVNQLVRDFLKTRKRKSGAFENVKKLINNLEEGIFEGSELEIELLEFLEDSKGKYGSLTPVKVEYDQNANSSEQGQKIIERAQKRLEKATKALAEASKDNKENAEKALRIAEDKLEYAKRKAGKLARAARNNMLMDISYAVLTHPDIAYQIHHPGNFDNVKRASKVTQILENEQILNDLIENKGGVENMIDYILDPNNTAKTFDKLLTDYKTVHNPCVPGTFEYFHKQNMTGDALIGMYANNVSAHAKFQGTGIRAKETMTFLLNGKKFGAISNMEVDSIKGLENKLIAFNCSEFLAAAVDNAKDPTLFYLRQNKKTANITAAMLKLGMSIADIGLAFTHTGIRNTIDLYGGLSERAINYMRSNILKVLEKRGIDIKNDLGSISSENLTSRDLIKNILTFNRVSDIEQASKIDNITLLEDAKRNLRQLAMIEKILRLSNDMKTIVKNSRSDSPNGAILPSIAQAKMQRRAIDLIDRRERKGYMSITGLDSMIKNNVVSANSTKDYMREAFMQKTLSSLQAFYSLGIDVAPQLISKYFPQGSVSMDTIVDDILDNTASGIVNSKRYTENEVIADDIYEDMALFALAGTKFFGDDGEDTYEKKRDYYIYEYPRIFMETLENNSDIAEIPIMQKMQVKNGKICLINSGRMTSTMRDELMNQLDSLLYLDNPKAQEMIEDLVKYSYYVEKLSFGPNSYGNYLSPLVLNKFQEVMDAYRNMERFYENETNRQNFKDQFFAQRGVGLLKSVINGVSIGNGIIKINPKDADNPNTESPSYYDYIYYVDSNGKDTGMYELLEDRGNAVFYKKKSSYLISDYVKYNPGKTSDEMEEYKFNKLKWNMLSTLQNRVTRKKSNEEAAMDRLNSSNTDINMEAFDPYFESGIEDIETLGNAEVFEGSEIDSFSIDNLLEDSDFETALQAMEDIYPDDESMNQMELPFCK